jgi:hypothetical protein
VNAFSIFPKFKKQLARLTRTSGLLGFSRRTALNCMTASANFSFSINIQIDKRRMSESEKKYRTNARRGENTKE